MISYLQGNLISKKDKFIVLEVNGVGYKIFLSQKTLSKIPQKEQNLKVFCSHHIRENISDLYGFLDEKEMEFFELLEEIRGVGPKAALEISSLGPLEKIKESILKQDAGIFEAIPGVGRKRAMTIILELTGKIKNMSEQKDEADDEVVNALAKLGFSRQEANSAFKKIPRGIKTAEGKIKETLKILGK